MTPETQQFVIRVGFLAIVGATLISLMGLAALAIVHDGQLADTMVNLFQQIIQQGLYLVGGLVGLHTVATAVVQQSQARGQAQVAVATVAAGVPAGTPAIEPAAGA